MTTTQSQQDTTAVTTRIVDHYDGRKRAWGEPRARGDGPPLDGESFPPQL